MRIAIVGYGTVARNFHKMIEERMEEIKRRFGLVPKVVAVCDRGGFVYRQRGLKYAELARVKEEKGTVAALEGGVKGGRGVEMIDSVEAEVLVEASVANFENGQPAMDHIIRAFERRMHVITCNKPPLALAMPSLVEMAWYYGVEFLYSGTVGGGTPFLSFATRALKGNTILSLRGILNGTTNFILTKMEEMGWDFEKALREARRLGYAEENPTLDISGLDAAAKLVILVNHAIGRRITLKDVRISGIEDVNWRMIESAKKRGRSIKLVARSDPIPQVGVEEVEFDDPLNVRDTLNAVAFNVSGLGEVVLIGRGAGGVETASSLFRDMVELKDRLSLKGMWS